MMLSNQKTPMLAKAVVALALLAQAARAKDFRVQFNVETTSGPGSFIVRVHEDWAPIGAARFKEAVEAGFYDDTRTLRAPTLFFGGSVVSGPATGRLFPRHPFVYGTIRVIRRSGHICIMAFQNDQ